MIDYQCPSRPNSLLVDIDVNQYYYNQYPTSPIARVAFAVGYNQLYELSINDFGQAKYKSIEVSSNSMLVSAFGIAGAIAILGAIFSVHLSHMLFKEIRKRYNKFLIGQKQLAITMKQSKATKEEGSLDFKSLLSEFEGIKKIYELKGLFRTTFKSDPEFIRKSNLSFSFSLYQIPALVLDFFFRKRVNSIQQFLSEIAVSKLQFPSKKFLQFDKTDVSMPLFEFQQKYSDFCSKNGYSEVQQIETAAKDVLKTFNITIEQNEGKMTPAYVNIKFKSLKEKAESEPADDHESTTVINQFLNTECTFSQFESDYISFDELKVAYIVFCKKMGIPESKRE